MAQCLLARMRGITTTLTYNRLSYHQVEGKFRYITRSFASTPGNDDFRYSLQPKEDFSVQSRDWSDGSPQVWEKVDDPNSGGEYYWCKELNETTAVGVERPKSWTQVTDRNTGEFYWWCAETDETTAIGADVPKWDDDLTVSQSGPVMPISSQNGMGLGKMFIFGAGMSLMFGLVGAVFR